MAGVMNEAETSFLQLAVLVEPVLFQPPPGLEMLGPGSVLSRQETRDTQPENCKKDVSISDRSTADAWEADDSSSLEGSDYCSADVLRVNERLSSGGLELREHPRQLIQLEKLLPEETCGFPGCPSIGSAGHRLGMCRPCDFRYRSDGCRAGSRCQYCHLCPHGERQHRRKKAAARMMTRMTANGSVHSTASVRNDRSQDLL